MSGGYFAAINSDCATVNRWVNFKGRCSYKAHRVILGWWQIFFAEGYGRALAHPKVVGE